MIIVDAHQDLAWNILTFGRDYGKSALDTRRREAGTDAPTQNGDTLLGWPDYQKGRVAVVFSTIFAAPAAAQLGPWDTQFFANVGQAHQVYQDQLDAYYRLVDKYPDKFHLLLTLPDLRQVLEAWEADDKEPGPPARNLQDNAPLDPRDGPPAGPLPKLVGLVPLMEGAEGVRSPGELEDWWERGVRLIGPAWAGTRFCGGTRQPGPLTKEGFGLLEGMAEVGFGLDISHMDEQAVLQALDIYSGTIIASHANAHALLKGMETNRHLSDRVIKGLLERGGVIGVVPYNRFLLPGWQPNDGRHLVTLEHLIAHIDHICQLAGDARHVGIGTDFDGGFGVQSAPADIDTIADLRKLIPLLSARGYTEEDTASILGMNWIRVLMRILPEVR
jgi:membrane dipeptidase